MSYRHGPSTESLRANGRSFTAAQEPKNAPSDEGRSSVSFGLLMTGCLTHLPKHLHNTYAIQSMSLCGYQTSKTYHVCLLRSSSSSRPWYSKLINLANILIHSVQIGSGACATSYRMCTGVLSPGIKPGHEADHFTCN
jgi:hypothetical protein